MKHTEKCVVLGEETACRFQGMRRRGVTRALCALLGWGLLLPGPPVEAQRIQVGQEFINSRTSVLWLGQEKGFFTKEGLEVEVVPIRGGTAGAQAMTSGQIQFSLSATAASIPAIAAGSDIVELMNFEPVTAYLLVGSKDLKNPTELKGKRVGVSGLGLSNSSLGARLALKHFGLDPVRDQIALVAVGTETERVLAIVSGSVAATVLGPEFRTKAEQAGTQVLADLRTLGIAWAGSNLVTTRRYLHANPEISERVLKALLRAIAFIRDPQNKPAVFGIFKEKLRYPKLESIQFMVREAAAFLPQIGRLKAEEVALLEPLKALDQSGWIDSLYRTPGRFPR